MDSPLYGGIEAGGTKFICALATAADNIISQIEIPTTTPEETLQKVIAFFTAQPHLIAIGVASFGPLDLDKQSPTYGYITTTPKDGWANFNFVGTLKAAFNVPIALDTDVNGAALGEYQYGAGKGLQSLAYMSVGTGIGIGCISDGKAVRGIAHSESGHMLIPRSPFDTDFGGACQYHGSCLEGLASGTAMRQRWNMPARTITDENAWLLEGYYLAAGIVNIIVTMMPAKVIVGGGVMNHPGLIEIIRAKVLEIMNGYIRLSQITDTINDYIVAPELGTLSGVCGAIALCQNL